MNKLIFTLQLGFLLISFNAFSQQSDPPIIAKFFVERGIEYGGDELLTILFINRDNQTMRAEQGAYIAVGGQLEFKEVKNSLFELPLVLNTKQLLQKMQISG